MGLGNFRQNVLPYCMEYQTDGGWVFLNREYQPIGFNKAAFYNYSRENLAVYFKGMTKRKIDFLSTNPEWLKRFDERDCRKIWFYDDGCTPARGKKYRDAYFEKLAVLMAMQTYAHNAHHPERIRWLWLTPEARRKYEK